MNQKVLKVFKYRKVFFSISIALIVLGIIATAFMGVTLDIQFKGGAIIKYTYDGELTSQQKNDIPQLVQDTLSRSATLQTTDEGTKTQKMVLNLTGNQGLSAELQNTLHTKLQQTYPQSNFAISETNIVEPFIGERFMRNGIIAIVLASVLIIIYIWIRFKQISGLSAGVMAIIALLQDCALVFYTFVIFRIPIGDTFVAVMLTIIGYSINNTVIIYDRIRENSGIASKMKVEDLMDLSISQSMSRSIGTAFAAIAAISTVYIFAAINGLQSIEDFSLPMAIGMISGFFSANFIACPLWVMWQKKKHTSHK